VSTVIFRRGDRGPAVAEVKARLARLGLLSGSSHVRDSASLRSLMYPHGGTDTSEPSHWETTALVSADFDEELEQAVRQFQRERGITVDGIVGPETFRRLEEARWQLGDRVLSFQPGHLFVGEDALQLQRQLSRMGFDCGKEDAYFGTLTDRALREFQRNTGLVVDGIAGPETLRALGRLHRTVGAESAHTARERYSLPNLRTGIAGKLVVLDASPVNHGSAGLTDRIAALTAERLAPMGAVVSLPSTVDSHGGALDELSRALACNEADADLVVSFHVDQIDETAPALAVFYYGSDALHFSAAGRAAAEEIRAELLVLADCVIEARSWDILRATRMPSVRVFFGRSGQDDVLRRISDPGFQAALATAIADGLAAFFVPPTA